MYISTYLSVVRTMTMIDRCKMAIYQHYINNYWLDREWDNSTVIHYRLNHNHCPDETWIWCVAPHCFYQITSIIQIHTFVHERNPQVWINGIDVTTTLCVCVGGGGPPPGCVVILCHLSTGNRNFKFGAFPSLKIKQYYNYKIYGIWSMYLRQIKKYLNVFHIF
jgi:hypothetical protein